MTPATCGVQTTLGWDKNKWRFFEIELEELLFEVVKIVSEITSIDFCDFGYSAADDKDSRHIDDDGTGGVRKGNAGNGSTQ